MRIPLSWLGEHVALQVILGAVIVLASVAAISLEGRWRSIVPADRAQKSSVRPIEQASSD